MILAIDQGTTGSTCIVFDEEGRPAGRAYREFGQHFPRPGWVEHDANEIWEVTRAVAHEAHEAAGAPALAGIGITNQRETVVAWDRGTGEPLHRAIVWQDRRTAARCDELRAAGHEPLVRERTGPRARPVLLRHEDRVAAARGRRARASARRSARSTPGSPFKLTGRHVTDLSNASRTLLFDIHALGWDAELCGLLGVDPALAARAAAERAGCSARRASSAASRPRGRRGRRPAGRALRAGVPRAGARQEHLRHGQLRARERGRRGAAAGGRPAHHRGVGGARGAWTTPLEAAIFVTGAAVQWLRDALGVIGEAAETEALARLARRQRRRLPRARASPASARRTGTRTRAARSSA